MDTVEILLTHPITNETLPDYADIFASIAEQVDAVVMLFAIPAAGDIEAVLALKNYIKTLGFSYIEARLLTTCSFPDNLLLFEATSKRAYPYTGVVIPQLAKNIPDFVEELFMDTWGKVIPKKRLKKEALILSASELVELGFVENI